MTRCVIDGFLHPAVFGRKSTLEPARTRARGRQLAVAVGAVQSGRARAAQRPLQRPAAGATRPTLAVTMRRRAMPSATPRAGVHAVPAVGRRTRGGTALRSANQGGPTGFATTGRDWPKPRVDVPAGQNPEPLRGSHPSAFVQQMLTTQIPSPMLWPTGRAACFLHVLSERNRVGRQTTGDRHHREARALWQEAEGNPREPSTH